MDVAGEIEDDVRPLKRDRRAGTNEYVCVRYLFTRRFEIILQSGPSLPVMPGRGGKVRIQKEEENVQPEVQFRAALVSNGSELTGPLSCMRFGSGECLATPPEFGA
jgi:hypothetical protein